MPFSVTAWFLSSYCVCHSTGGRMAQTTPFTSYQIEPILVHISLLSISILFQKSLWTEPRSVHYPSPLSFNHFPPTFISCYVLVWLLFSVYCIQIHRDGTSLWTEDKTFVVRRKFAPQATNQFLEKVQGQLCKAGWWLKIQWYLKTLHFNSIEEHMKKNVFKQSKQPPNVAFHNN